ncbi:PEK/GCN2 protein kinase Gcn2 [Schizosaccharomyces octosporus yFS286]|uniref:non-specific serine/threonine protein kinase n=1 Tax=Schizosaccharomyces octosporus (strain yFS286) TaxID=483514 RepID=S9PX56_SCHOY|nr:PEK/GCN2 protein kinase Gcn2 [Schizosaccharomyces octosporus yFS286]EPX72567.1 PEK/GCN2 protein kinase Gcn2 [Schizosaccharomyces octosporus yFS286]
MDAAKRLELCRETQQNEIAALKAIFMDDFEELKSKNAWNVSNGRVFAIHLCSRSASAKSIAKVDLHIELGRSYPYVKPIVKLQNGENVLKSQIRFLLKKLDQKAKELLGEEMIFEFASIVQEYLNDWQSDLSSQFASLEEERAVQLQQDRERAEMDKQLKLEREKEALYEEEKILQNKIRDELQRRSYDSPQSPKEKRKDYVTKLTFDRLPSSVYFDCSISVKNYQDSLVEFHEVIPLYRISSSPLSTLALAKAHIDEALLPDCIFMLRMVRFTNPYYSTEAGKKSIQDLESELEDLKVIRHDLLASIYEYQLQREVENHGWRLYILQEYSNKLTLAGLLQTIVTLDVETVRTFSNNILEGLAELHRLGISHRNLHLDNVILFQSGHKTFAKLMDFCFTRTLRDMNASSPFNAGSQSIPGILPDDLYPPEVNESSFMSASRKTDIWCFGLMVLQMLCGMHVLQKFSSLKLLFSHVIPLLPGPYQELIRRCLMRDPKKRPTATDLLASQVIRLGTSILSTVEQGSLGKNPRMSYGGQDGIIDMLYRKSVSRYETDFEEIEFLGKGGFGEVVKVKNRIDGRFYAIKKLLLHNNDKENSRILREVMTLSRLHHDHVVRYYTAWVETDTSEKLKESDSEEESFVPSSRITSDLQQSSRYTTDDLSDLDIHFEGEASSPKSSETSSETSYSTSSTSEDLNLRKSESDIRTISTSKSGEPNLNATLYVQMEYCEKLSLQDIIREKLQVDEIWRLFRQILEALAYIHSRGMMHRDLKPGNVFLDENRNVKLGDFGLATDNEPSQVINDKSKNRNADDGELTSGVGTALYVAPELLKKTSGLHYDAKVDMYSLGIILFEMCMSFSTSMERIRLIDAIRSPFIILPDNFPFSLTSHEYKVIHSLLQHDPAKRPSSQELLESEAIPPKVGEEYIQEGLKLLSNRNSPYYSKLLKVLFSQVPDRHKDYTYDFNLSEDDNAISRVLERGCDSLFAGLVRDHIVQVFRRHGATERESQALFPKSTQYGENKALVSLLDKAGTLLQLPYDTILPYARNVARNAVEEEKTYLVADVYRESYGGGKPKAIKKISFDLTTNSDNLDWFDAECIKVLDEVLLEIPSLVNSCIWINHADIFSAILDFLQISREKRNRTSQILGQKNQGFSFSQIRNQLRNESLVPSTTLDDLNQFDFCVNFEEGINRIRRIFGKSMTIKMRSSLNYLEKVWCFLKGLKLSHPVFFVPLSVHSHEFYEGGIMFQAVHTPEKAELLCAGGRYDKLVRLFDPPLMRTTRRKHVVGMSLGLESIVSSVSRYIRFHSRKQSKVQTRSPITKTVGSWLPRRVDVLVTSIGKDSIMEKCALLQELWSLNIRADIVLRGATSLEEIVTRYKSEGVNWVLVVRQKNTQMEHSVKARNIMKNEDDEIKIEEVGVWLLGEINERKRNENLSQTRQVIDSDIQDYAKYNDSLSETNLDVQLVPLKGASDRKYKWKHKQNAMNKVYDLVQSAIHDSTKDALALAVDCDAPAMQRLKSTSLKNEESWKKLVDSCPASQREYMQRLQTKLTNLAEKGRNRVWICSFRTNEIYLYGLN